MRLIDADALIETLNNKKVVGRFNTIKLVNEAPTIEPRIEYGSDGEPYRLFISGGHVVPDTLQGWRYEERPIGKWIEEYSEVGAMGIKYAWLKCNRCGWSHSLLIPRNYCPKCGAKMR